MNKHQELEAARNLEPDCTYGAVGAGRYTGELYEQTILSQQEDKQMIKEHEWKKIYAGSDVEQCANCPVQRRSGGSGKWQYRASSADLGWVASSGRTAPDCSDAGNTWFGSGYRSPITDEDRLGTEQLEAELKELSTRIAADPLRFQQVREELVRRHAAGNDQPAPETEEQRLAKETEASTALQNNLILKITAMEAEQAKLVVEAEIFKHQRDEAENRLALLARTSTVVSSLVIGHLVVAIQGVPSGEASETAPDWIVRLHRAACAVAGIQVIEKSEAAPTTTPHLEDMRKMLEKHVGPVSTARKPMSREAARELAARFRAEDNLNRLPLEWVVDAVVEASK